MLNEPRPGPDRVTSGQVSTPGTSSDAVESTTYRFASWRPAAPAYPNLWKRLSQGPWRAILFAGIVFTVSGAIFLFMISHCSIVFLSFWGSGIGALYARTFYGRTPRAIVEMMDIPFTNTQFPVQIKLRSNIDEIGKDIGVITFANDLLHFEGRKTSFEIPTGLIQLSVVSPSRTFGSTPDHGPYKLRWSTGTYFGEIDVNPYQSVSGSSKNFAPAFRSALIAWTMADPEAHTRLILPPRERRPRISQSVTLNHQ